MHGMGFSLIMILASILHLISGIFFDDWRMNLVKSDASFTPREKSVSLEKGKVGKIVFQPSFSGAMLVLGSVVNPF